MDRLTGSLDGGRARTEGARAYEPGLLAAAHRGILYVDEVNLLPGHLMDLLLDAAAMGEARVEREGVSVRHAARFVLVGTMNPDEGELRPQLLDRFGLTVRVEATRDPDERAEVVRRRLAFERDPVRFAAGWAMAEAELAARIASAQARLARVRLPDAALAQITAACAAFGVDGLRADLVMARAAMALAAWNRRTSVTTEDVRTAARLALPHRRGRDPFDAPGLDEEKLDAILREHAVPEDEEIPEAERTIPDPRGRLEWYRQPSRAWDPETEARVDDAEEKPEEPDKPGDGPPDDDGPEDGPDGGGPGPDGGGGPGGPGGPNGSHGSNALIRPGGGSSVLSALDTVLNGRTENAESGGGRPGDVPFQRMERAAADRPDSADGKAA